MVGGLFFVGEGVKRKIALAEFLLYLLGDLMLAMVTGSFKDLQFAIFLLAAGS